MLHLVETIGTAVYYQYLIAHLQQGLSVFRFLRSFALIGRGPKIVNDHKKTCCSAPTLMAHFYSMTVIHGTIALFPFSCPCMHACHSKTTIKGAQPEHSLSVRCELPLFFFLFDHTVCIRRLFSSSSSSLVARVREIGALFMVLSYLTVIRL